MISFVFNIYQSNTLFNLGAGNCFINNELAFGNCEYFQLKSFTLFQLEPICIGCRFIQNQSGFGNNNEL